MTPVRMPRFPRDRTSYVKDGEIEPDLWYGWPALYKFVIVACVAVAVAGLVLANRVHGAWQ